MKGYVLTVERVVSASPDAVFDILTDVSRHRSIDGSGMLQGRARTIPNALHSAPPSAWA